ncbi:phosphate signaling complex protein PhoU [bacterium]|nr:phosphate signaling complex protein PhoU [bacterium]RQV93261.1 MAG: phosphate signaling complex protein PhoU [bacterium]
MLYRLQREIENLKKRILTLGALVEEHVYLAVKAISDRDEKLAQQVIDGDMKIDEMEVDLEEECLKLLALHQPVAIDLRFIVAVLKINNDLERIGDLAVNIGERAAYLAVKEPVKMPFDFKKMTDKVRTMLKKSLDSLVNVDTKLALEVGGMDDEVDAINRETYRKVAEGIKKHPEQSDCLLHLLSVSRHLERMADQATNIAEDVIYMIDGTIVRHKTEKYVTSSIKK